MKTSLLLLLGLFSASAFAQSDDEKGIRAAITQLFDGMRKADTTLFKAVFAPTASLQSIAKNKEGVISVRSESIPNFVTSVGKQKPGALDERLSAYDVKIDAELAIAWTPYVFYFNGQKSHCGVNVFTLVKLNGSWKIQSIIDTRRREGCPDL
ncbi:nuclear transport factor 2 family protein [Larkinella humicola]|uniref:Nuclear transport factor 2 family protein n=1 Tax=Larkinella humicola TaxID=2607654 RepID=A0A5N1JG04_9BACT|nr:nuclear transport factor 2 family protein [Larkinella humicola]KAA9353962.1 nuclear transport factor 2 family protein [Larkinella humicola]